MDKIELDIVCTSCKGTGLYVGFAEHDGAAVVCRGCKGTGCHHYVMNYTLFVCREVRNDVKRVYRINPGIGIGEGKEKQYKLEDFGGMPYEEWACGKLFPKGSENRSFVCPAWWYQSADSKKKPGWGKCLGGGFGAFSSCDHYSEKSICWAQWDREFGGDTPESEGT